MRITTFFIALLLSGTFLQAEGFYDVELIDDALRKDAYAVLRMETTQIKVENETRSIMTVTKAVTVLDAKGLDYAALGVPYDDFDKILAISAIIYDKTGKQVESIRAKDFSDISYSASSMATDTRIRAYKPSTSAKIGLPFTIEYTYSIQTKGLFSFPRWIPLDEEKLSIEFASLEVSVPHEGFIRYRSQNLDKEPIVKKEDGQVRYLWEIRSMVAFERQPMSPSFWEQVPTVHLAPSAFNIQGFQGASEDWEQLGSFFYKLNDGRQELPQELKTKVDQLTAGITEPLEKARILYEFMQKNTRYVSIQLGIGGWQTFDADYVYRNGYGDCKALTNYMQSMLRHLNISSYAALVYAGESKPDILTDFPASQFNHVILCIPQGNDTTWLECTSSFGPFGYLGDFTENRHVLLLTPSGGKLVKTPGSTAEMNQQFRHTEVQLDSKGNASVKVKTVASGFQQTALRYHAKEASEREQQEYLRKRIDVGSFEIGEYAFVEGNQTDLPTYELHYTLTAPNWAKASGPRLFVSPNVLERQSYVPEKMEDRSQSIKLPFAYLDRDTVIYHLPQGYQVESVNTDPTEISTIFGSYHARVEVVDPTTLIYYRELRMEKMELPPSYYEPLREFFKSINQADRMQLVLSNRS